MIENNVSKLYDLMIENPNIIIYFLNKESIYSIGIEKISKIDFTKVNLDKINEDLEMICRENHIFVFYVEKYLLKEIPKIAVFYYSNGNLYKETITLELKCMCCINHVEMVIKDMSYEIVYDETLNHDFINFNFIVNVKTLIHFNLKVEKTVVITKLNIKRIH